VNQKKGHPKVASNKKGNTQTKQSSDRESFLTSETSTQIFSETYRNKSALKKIREKEAESHGLKKKAQCRNLDKKKKK